MRLENLDLLRSISKGERVAYVDRHRRRFAKPVTPESTTPLPVSQGFLSSLKEQGWGAIYSGSGWRREFWSMATSLLNAGLGFSEDAIKGAFTWFARHTGFARGESRLGVVEAIYGLGGRPHASVRIPHANGGYSRHEFRVVSTPEFAMSLGQPVEFFPSHGSRRPRLRPLSPPSAIGLDGRLKHLSLFELVSVVMGQSSSMDFVGLWENKPLPESHRGVKCLPRELASLYVHAQTGEGVLVFRGTRPFNFKDWLVNVKTTHALASSQHTAALNTVDAASRGCPRLVLTGHSKGGGLAQLLSAKTGFPAVTLNSVGLPSGVTETLESSPLPFIEHFMTKFDTVSNLGGNPNAISPAISGPLAFSRGHRQRLLGDERSRHVIETSLPRHRILSLHSLSSLREHLRENPVVIPDPTSPTRQPSYALAGVYVDPVRGDLLYEPKFPEPSVEGKSMRKSLQRSGPTLSKKRTVPSSSRNSVSPSPR